MVVNNIIYDCDVKSPLVILFVLFVHTNLRSNEGCEFINRIPMHQTTALG